MDTSKAAVAAAALKSGADIINDVWGLQRDAKMAATIAQADAACIRCTTERAITGQSEDVVSDVRVFLRRSVELALAAGIRSDAIILDPGFGFGKRMKKIGP